MPRNNDDFDKGATNSPFGTGPHGGDRETDFPNDSGWGTHIERPGVSCTYCPAKFHFHSGLTEHVREHH